MSSTFEWNDIAGALPWGTDWMAGPSGQVSRVFLAESETHAGPEEVDPEEDEDEVEGPPKPSAPPESVAALATRTPPSARPSTTAGTPNHKDRTRFISTSRTST